MKTARQQKTGATPNDSAPPTPSANPRIVLESASLSHSPGSRVSVRVTVGWNGKSVETERRAVGLENVILRTAAEATLAAIRAATGQCAWAGLVGVKKLNAFDASVILVCLRREDHPGRRLIGAVPVRDNVAHAAAAAVLSAVNRALNAPVGTDEPSETA